LTDYRHAKVTLKVSL